MSPAASDLRSGPNGGLHDIGARGQQVVGVGAQAALERLDDQRAEQRQAGRQDGRLHQRQDRLEGHDDGSRRA